MEDKKSSLEWKIFYIYKSKTLEKTDPGKMVVSLEAFFYPIKPEMWVYNNLYKCSEIKDSN